jgi:hypothetical protein
MRRFSVISLSVATALTATGLTQADTITTQVFTSSANPSGGITVTIDNQGTPVDALGNTLNGYTAYTMTISTNTSGWYIGIVDFGNENLDPRTGFNGTLSEEDLVSSSLSGTTTTPVLYSTNTNSPTGNFSLGSHFLFDQTSTGWVIAGKNGDNFTQSTTGAFSGLNTASGQLEFGTGTYLRGASGFPTDGNGGTTPIQSLPVAYLVTPSNSPITYNAQVELGTTSNNQDAINLVGTIPVPEPATMALFALGGVGILTLGRKRKQV